MTIPCVISESLIEYLESMFPTRIPTSKDFSLDDLRYRQGQISVIDHLKVKLKEQSLNVFRKEDE